MVFETKAGHLFDERELYLKNINTTSVTLQGNLQVLDSFQNGKEESINLLPCHIMQDFSHDKKNIAVTIDMNYFAVFELMAY